MDKRCLQQAHFKFEDGSWKSSRPLLQVQEERKREDLATDLGSLSLSNKCYILLSNLIKEFSNNVNKQFLGVAKQIKALDDKVNKLDKDVYAIGQLLVHVKGVVCWIKDDLKQSAESESEDEEKEEKKEKEKRKKKKEEKKVASSSEYESEDYKTESDEAVDKP